MFETFGMGMVLSMRNMASTGMRSARKDFDQLYVSAGKADKMSQKSLDHIQDQMRRGRREMLAGGAIVGAMGALSMANRDTEQYTADLRSLGTKAAKEHVKAIRQALAQEDLPLDYADSIQQLYNQYSAGIKEEDLVPTFKTAGITALATMGDISDAMDAFTNDYNLSLSKMDGSIEDRATRWSDIIASSVRTYKTKLPELGEQHQKIATDAKLMGYELETTYTAIGTLLSGGLGAEAGTSLRRALQNINRASKITGLNFKDAEGNAKPLLEIIDQLVGKYGKSNLDELEELDRAFGIYGKKAITTLMEMRDKYEEGIIAAQEHGTGMKMAGIRMDTLNMDIAALGNSMDNLGDTMGENGIDMRKWVQNIDDAIDAISTFVDLHPSVAKMGIALGSLMGGFLLGGGLIRVITAAASGWGTLAANTFFASFSSILLPMMTAFLGTWLIKKHVEDIYGKGTVEAEGMGVQPESITKNAPSMSGPGFTWMGEGSGGPVYPYHNYIRDRENAVYGHKTPSYFPENTTVEFERKKTDPAPPVELRLNTTIQIEGSKDSEKTADDIARIIERRAKALIEWEKARRGEA